MRTQELIRIFQIRIQTYGVLCFDRLWSEKWLGFLFGLWFLTVFLVSVVFLFLTYPIQFIAHAQLPCLLSDTTVPLAPITVSIRNVTVSHLSLHSPMPFPCLFPILPCAMSTLPLPAITVSRPFLLPHAISCLFPSPLYLAFRGFSQSYRISSIPHPIARLSCLP